MLIWRIQSRYFFSRIRNYFHPIKTNMEALERERKELEDQVVKLVGDLEKFKVNGPKLTPEQIIRPKNEIADEVSQETQQSVPSQQKTSSKSQTKLETTGGNEQQKAKSGRTKEPPAPEKPIDVSRLDLRIGKIVSVERHPDADALYVEKIDCGDTTGPRTIISGLVNHVPIEEMQDRLVLVLCNLKPVKMRGILSEGMVMCASGDKVEILNPMKSAKVGDRAFVEKFPGTPDEQLNPKKKIWEQIAPDLKTDDEGVCRYKGEILKINDNGNSEGFFVSNLKNVQVR